MRSTTFLDHPFLALCILPAVLLTGSGTAHAEYVENQMARSTAAWTLAIGGSATVVSDVGCVIYLAGGRDNRWGRIVTGVGSIVGATGIAGLSILALMTSGEGHIPMGGGDTGSEERTAMNQARVLAGINLTLAAASLGIGIASLATYGSSAKPATSQGVQAMVVPIYSLDKPGMTLLLTF